MRTLTCHHHCHCPLSLPSSEPAHSRDGSLHNPTVCLRRRRLGGSSKRPVVTADRPICPSHGAGHRFTVNRTKPGRGMSRQAYVSQTRQLPAWRQWKQLRPHLYFKPKCFPKSRSLNISRMRSISLGIGVWLRNSFMYKHSCQQVETRRGKVKCGRSE